MRQNITNGLKIFVKTSFTMLSKIKGNLNQKNLETPTAKIFGGNP